MAKRKKTLFITVEPSVLAWAINSSGFSTKELILKLKVSDNTIEKWLSGDKKLSLNQLEKLSSILKRPLAAFFLSEPPKEKPLPKDYRMIPDRLGKFENKTVLAIRNARRLQRVSKELSENIRKDIDPERNLVDLSVDPKRIANEYTAYFKITPEVRQTWKTPYDAFKFFRGHIEDMNIVVFKMSMLVEDARGFTLTDESPAIIVVNSKDAPEAQVFTLLHELGHILLNKSGVSIPDNALFHRDKNQVENWCNEFASEILLPVEIAKRSFTKYSGRLTDTESLQSLSRKFKISKAMLLYNMLKLNFITSTQYNSTLQRYDPTRPQPKKIVKGTGAISPDKKCLSERGQKFVSLVAKNMDGGHITRSDALDYLSIKSRNLERVMMKASK